MGIYMRNIVELSDGNVFLKGSVVHVGPMDRFSEGFLVTGVGFKVTVVRPELPNWDIGNKDSFGDYINRFIALRQEYIDKLLCA